jgi:aspartyl/asparaginyl beta-hydroxylase (cupin superfamily)
MMRDVVDARKSLIRPGRRGRKRALVRAVDDLYRWAERRGWMQRLPAFRRDYHGEYPELRVLEDGYPAIREECLGLLDIKEQLTDLAALGGRYTAGGVNAIRWKTFAFKIGGFVPENCARCPRTARLLERVPGLFTAFFSVLEARQYIRPHWGYYKGFVRYHLGVAIPEDNARRRCRLRVNADPAQNARRDRSLIENAEAYYWRNGEGVMFDDTNLHDSRNDTDEPRVVLFLDLYRRSMPLPLDLFNRAALALARIDGSVRRMHDAAIPRPHSN